MSTCYKCGRELPGADAECDPPCAGPGSFNDEQFAAVLERHLRNQVHIDWDKVRSFEDLLEIARTIFQDATIYRGSPAYYRLKRFLKSEADGQP